MAAHVEVQPVAGFGIRLHIEIAMPGGKIVSSNACAHSDGAVIRLAKQPGERNARSCFVVLVGVSWPA